MAVQLNHTIVWAYDKHESAAFMADLLGLGAPTRYGSFVIVHVDNDVSLDFLDVDETVHPQHYAFIVDEEGFDEIFERICARGLSYWADPGQEQQGEINTRDGGRGVYWEDPNGHLLEIITQPYGSLV
ncbi:MAG: VOC family protein [Actinomycetes bacterium]